MNGVRKVMRRKVGYLLLVGSIVAAILIASLIAPIASSDYSASIWRSKLHTSITMTSNSTNLNVGENLHINGVLRGISGIGDARINLKVTLPDGSVSYPVQGSSTKTNSRGLFNVDYITNNPGTYSITTTFSGNTRYSSSSDVMSFTYTATPSIANETSSDAASSTPVSDPEPTPVTVPSSVPALNYNLKVEGNMVYDADGELAYSGGSAVGAINWAITNAPVDGVVLIKAGTYNINGDINMRSHVTLMGETGTPRTIPGTTMTFTYSSATTLNFTTISGIKSFNADNFVISNLHITGYGVIKLVSGAGAAGDRYNVAVRNVCIETTLRPFNEISAFTFYATDGHAFRNISFERCISLDSCGAGFLLRGDTESGAYFDHVVITDCLSLRAGLASPRSWNWAVGFDVAERNTINDVVFTRCEADYSFESGFHWEDFCPTTNCSVYDCVANYNGQKPADFKNGESWCPYGPGFGAGFMFGGPNSKGITLYDCTGVGNTKGFYVNK